MKRFRLRRPSAAMIVAAIALIAAIGGTAIAGSPFVTKTRFKKFKQTTNSSLAQTVKGPLNYVTVNFSNPPTGAGSGGTDVAASCPAGSAVTGGGIKVENDVVQAVNDSHPTTAGWAGTVFNGGAAPHNVQVTAICATASTAGTRPSS
jgi:hypothetical protein